MKRLTKKAKSLLTTVALTLAINGLGDYPSRPDSPQLNTEKPCNPNHLKPKSKPPRKGEVFRKRQTGTEEKPKTITQRREK